MKRLEYVDVRTVGDIYYEYKGIKFRICIAEVLKQINPFTYCRVLSVYENDIEDAQDLFPNVKKHFSILWSEKEIGLLGKYYIKEAWKEEKVICKTLEDLSLGDECIVYFDGKIPLFRVVIKSEKEYNDKFEIPLSPEEIAVKILHVYSNNKEKIKLIYEEESYLHLDYLKIDDLDSIPKKLMIKQIGIIKYKSKTTDFWLFVGND